MTCQLLPFLSEKYDRNLFRCVVYEDCYNTVECYCG